MGNQFEKEYNIKQKPMKLPGSYNFLRFIHHPTEESSLIIIKSPHKATPISSTMILPIKQIKQLGSDTVAVCHKCLPLALVKPKSQTQMRILMHKILKSSSQIGRCFFYMGRIMLWCEQKRGFSCISPEQLQHGKPHQKSKVFTSGIALINFLHCVYEGEAAVKKGDKAVKKQNSLKSTISMTQARINQKMKEKGPINQSLPQQIKLFFQPKDKKDYYENYYNMETKLIQSSFWTIISEGLRELLLNMISEDPEKRIDLETIVNIPYFMESYQLRLYSTLSDDLESMSPKQAKIFMTALQLLVKQGLTIEQSLMQDYFLPVLCSMVLYNPNEGKQNDYIMPMVLSILLQVDKPPIEIICTAFKKSHLKNLPALRLVLSKKHRLLQLLQSEYFDSIVSRALFSSFESEPLIELALLSLPFAIKNIKQPNYRKEIEHILITKILMPSEVKENILLDGLKCMIFLVRQNLLTSPTKLQGLIYEPLKFGIQLNLHILYLYALIIDCLPPLQLLDKMMPKLKLYLNQLQILDQVFIVAKRCVDRILERLYEQRKIIPSQMGELDKREDYFEMKEDKTAVQPNLEQIKLILKKQIDKHNMEKLKWTYAIL